MNKRLIFIIYISYFVGLFLCAVIWSLVEADVNKSGENISSVTGSKLSKHNPTQDVVTITTISVCHVLLRVIKPQQIAAYFDKTWVITLVRQCFPFLTTKWSESVALNFHSKSSFPSLSLIPTSIFSSPVSSSSFCLAQVEAIVPCYLLTRKEKQYCKEYNL